MKEIITYKSGKFYFTEAYDAEKVNSMIIRAMVLNETIADLPILPRLASSLEPEIMYSSISGTAAIEGNPISSEDVVKLANGEDLPEYTQKDKQEIFNLIKAYKLFLSESKHSEKPFLVSEELIRNIHRVITKDIPHEHNIPGNYRNGKVEVGDKAHGGVYRPPKALIDIEQLMKGYVQWLNSEEILNLPPLLRAPVAHYHFSAIHPFWDGNGRTARIIEALILQSEGINYLPKELSNFYYKNVDDYYIAFSKTNKLKKDITPFIEFFFKAAITSLEKIKENIIFFIRLFSLRDYFNSLKENKKITKRQFELISLLLDYPPGFSFSRKDLTIMTAFRLLYLKVSIQTARRDLAKLTEMELLKLDDEGDYSLNFRVLG